MTNCKTGRARPLAAKVTAWCLLWFAVGAWAQPLTIAVSRTSLSLPLYVAQAKGLFVAEGVEVNLIQCLGGVRCMAELTSGKADLGTSSEIVGALLSFVRTDFALVASFVSSGQDVNLLTRKSANIKSWTDLAGKRIATVKGTSAHYYLDAALLYNGVPTKSIELVVLPPEQVGPALASGKVDAIAIWEPFAFETRRALGAEAVQLPPERLYTTTFNLFVMRETLARRQSDVVKVLKALERAEKFISGNPGEAQATLRAALQLDQAFIDAVWRNHDYRLTLAQSLVSTMEGQTRWAVRGAHVPAGSVAGNLLDIIEVGPLKQVNPSAVTLAK